MGDDDRDGRPTKRRRLTTSTIQQIGAATSTTTRIHSQFCSADRYEETSHTLRYHGGANIPIEPYCSPGVDPASLNGLGHSSEEEASDCCYGMVRRTSLFYSNSVSCLLNP